MCCFYASSLLALAHFLCDLAFLLFSIDCFKNESTLLALNKPIVLPKPLIDRPEPAPNEFSSASLGPAQRLTDLSDSAPPIEPKPPEPLSKPASMILIDFGINRAFFKTFLVSCGLRPLDPGFDALAGVC